MKKKLNIQLLIVTLCIAIPMICVFAYLEIKHNKSVRNELILSCQTDVQINMNQLDMMLEMTRDNMSYIAVDDSELNEIRDAKNKDTVFWMNMNRVIQKLNYQNMISKLSMVPFVYFPAQDVFVNGGVNEGVTRRLKAIIDEKKSSIRDNNIWLTLNIDGSRYLYCIIEADGIYLGAWVSYEDLLEHVQLKKSENYILTETVKDLEHRYFPDEMENIILCSSSQSDMTLIDVIDREWIAGQLSPVYENLITIIIALLVMFAVYIVCIRRWIIKPIRHLRKNMAVIQEGNLSHRIEKIPYASEEFSEVIDEFNYLMNSIESLKISIYESELEQKEIRLEYLSRQIQPHFILNSLNTLYMYNANDPELVNSIIKLISQYYRYVININSKYVALESELNHIENYIRIQQLRYPGRFTYEINCPDELKNTAIPPFVLESFVGNYFKHGMRSGGDNKIHINISREKEDIRILLEDNGPGFSEDSLDAIKDFLEERIVSEELGVGIRNSIERMELIYRNRCSVNIYNRDEGGAAVKIVISQETQNEDKDIDY